jgi:hypothetical protein
MVERAQRLYGPCKAWQAEVRLTDGSSIFFSYLWLAKPSVASVMKSARRWSKEYEKAGPVEVVKIAKVLHDGVRYNGPPTNIT